MKIVLISTYEMGRQPFGLASPAAWLKNAGFDVVCLDLCVQPLEPAAIVDADLIALHVPMHTATRIATAVLSRLKAVSPGAHLCAYGLYAPVNAEFLRKRGVDTILGGEFEDGLMNLAYRIASTRFSADSNCSGRESETNHAHPLRSQLEPEISLARQRFVVPYRSNLPPLAKYAHLELPDGTNRTTGYVEASRGCKYLCRHCPVVPVYNGQFRIVQREVVLGDIRQQVSAGATHITFGDPDFFNGPRHSIDIVSEFHRRFPDVTYDVTIKIEHILKHRQHLETLRDTGCLFVTSAVESLDDRVLQLLDKGHTHLDFLRAVELCDLVGIALSPTFVAFNPWIDLEGYHELLTTIADLGLIENVASVQLALRLLIPAGSYLLNLPEVARMVGPFDEEGLCYRWTHFDPRVDSLQHEIESLVATLTKGKESRSAIFFQVWERIQLALGAAGRPVPEMTGIPQRTEIPYLNEPWYC